jgi:hypothetical protein
MLFKKQSNTQIQSAVVKPQVFYISKQMLHINCKHGALRGKGKSRGKLDPVKYHYVMTSRMKWPERKADHPPPSSAEVKND